MTELETKPLTVKESFKIGDNEIIVYNKSFSINGKMVYIHPNNKNSVLDLKETLENFSHNIIMDFY